MGQTNDNQQQSSEPIQTKAELVDFLYIDSQRVDSFISQLKNRTLRSVSKTNATLQGSSNSSEITVDAKVLKGSFSGSEQTDNTVSSTENYDPFHKQVIDLINALQYDEINPNGYNEAQLGFVTGHIVIRNLSIFTDIVPVVFKHKNVFGALDKSAKENLKAMVDLINASPSTIDLSVSTDAGDMISGTIIEEYLNIPIGSILKNYGTSLPGKWSVIGIFDTSTPKLVTNDAEQVTVESMVDTYSETMNKFFASSITKVIPLVIFRVINS